MLNEPVESGSAFTVKDEMLMRGIGMQDAPLHSEISEITNNC